MGARTGIVAAALAAIGLMPSVASANGGAYIEFEGTHHLPGEQVTGELYVSIPQRRLGLLERGPFYAYLLPGNTSIEQGRPLPAGAIRVGTFVVEKAGTEARLSVSFPAPDVEGDFYQVGICNDPCTVSGFGETVSGAVSIVATAREAELLADNGTLRSQLSDAKRDLRKTQRSAEEEEAVTSAELAQSESSRRALTSRVRTLEHDLAVAAEAAGRPVIDPWVGVAVAVALVAVAWALAWRRRPSAGAEREPVPGGA